MMTAPIQLFRSEVDNALDDAGCEVTWDQLSPRNRRRLAILILRQRIDYPSAAIADLLTQGAPVADAFNIVEDLTGL